MTPSLFNIVMTFFLWTDYVDGDCPVRLVSTPYLKPGRLYKESIAVKVLAEAWGKDWETIYMEWLFHFHFFFSCCSKGGIKLQFCFNIKVSQSEMLFVSI